MKKKGVGLPEMVRNPRTMKGKRYGGATDTDLSG